MKKEVNCANCQCSLLRYQTKTDTYFCNTKCKGDWQQKQREALGFTKEWLCDQYFNQGKTCNDIAREIGRDGKRVWEWFIGYGIEVAKRGQYKPVHFKKGESSWLGKKHNEHTKEKIRQARKVDGHVPYLKDGVHWLKHPGAVSPNWKGGVTPERQSVYSSKEWCDAVKIVWKRDNATCQNCLLHQNEARDTKFHIHHIESFMVKEKRTDPVNLVLLCPNCHFFVHSKKNTKRLFIKP